MPLGSVTAPSHKYLGHCTFSSRGGVGPQTRAGHTANFKPAARRLRGVGLLRRLEPCLLRGLPVAMEQPLGTWPVRGPMNKLGHEGRNGFTARFARFIDQRLTPSLLCPTTLRKGDCVGSCAPFPTGSDIMTFKLSTLTMS
jgi:hypothetical protein